MVKLQKCFLCFIVAVDFAFKYISLFLEKLLYILLIR